MTTVSTSGGTVAYDCLGSGDPIVLLPSGGHDQHDYDEIRRLLPDGYRSIGVDWPGHGRSPAGTAASTELRLAQIVEELLESLTPDGAVLAGNSVGGNVAARLAIRRPDLVKGLMIIDGGGFEGSRLPGRVFCALMSHPWFVRRIYPLFSRAYTRPRTAADHRARADAIAITRTTPGLAAVTDIWRSFNLPEHDLRAQAGKITAPTVLIWGRHDPVLPLGAAETARDLIPGSRLVVIDSGHLPHTTSPAAVAAELTSLANSAFGGDSRTGDTLGLATTDPEGFMP
ncbi:alpha/beta fold hydrolase [Rugosimonospora africana]|uniref:3-oxoadipate enol-lactonase n=1 Tax=Rugosimonospora africana TaxID=556532 RepID=A0A8J3QZ37_9ACTN|nr:alpha/beta hydrolase [Rugosimonospora africana]GIH19216.1 3-oxoadipate enol-lactonase [Rugosimonospora africana]